MDKLPHNNPAAPAPEIALPIIRAAEFGEAAQRIEPISTAKFVRSGKEKENERGGKERYK
jgi:hypothetical protein